MTVRNERETETSQHPDKIGSTDTFRQVTSDNAASREQDVSLSLVLPCYCETDVFEASMTAIDMFFEDLSWEYEYVFVEDASGDGTAELIEEYIAEHDHAKAIFHEENCGRGQSVVDGIRAASNPIVGYLDIDLEVTIHQLYPLVRAVQNGADVICGYRHYKQDPSRFHRLLLSVGYKHLARLVIGSPFHDPEAGCKFFNRESILPVLKETHSDHWFWDTEVMMRAHDAGLKVKEHPVLFVGNDEAGSTVDIWSDIPDYLRNLWHFRRGNDEKLV